MKMFLAASVLLLASFAQAEVKPFGSFVPQACSLPGANTGFSTEQVSINKVCLGKLAGSNKVAVQLFINDGHQEIYVIKLEEKVIRMGANTQNFQGENLTWEESSIQGQLITVMGIRKSMIIKVQTSENLKFQGNIEAVFTTL